VEKTREEEKHSKREMSTMTLLPENRRDGQIHPEKSKQTVAGETDKKGWEKRERGRGVERGGVWGSLSITALKAKQKKRKTPKTTHRPPKKKKKQQY